MGALRYRDAGVSGPRRSIRKGCRLRRLLVASISEGVIHLFQFDLQDPAKPRISVAELCYIERAFRAGSHSRRECQACQQICDLARITDAYYLSAAGHREVSLRGSFQRINFAIHECEADDCGQTIE